MTLFATHPLVRFARAFILVVATGVGVAACSSVQTTQPGAIGVNRRQYMIVSEQEVEQAAQQSYAQELDKARGKGSLNSNAEDVRRVKAIAQRLIPQTSVFRPDAQQWSWEVNVETSDDVNAYCMPGGKIMVYTGLIHALDTTDDELAAVIGHEMAHALREHTRERVSRAYAQQLALTGIAVLTGAGQGTVALASKVTEVTFTLPHSREQEAEADRVGVELMARAGYRPEAAISLWQKMAKQGSGGPAFLSTHPSDEARISDIRQTIPRVQALYDAAKR